LGRFISADTVVPGSAALTLWPGDGVAAALWATDGGGPQNPQDLNRYRYVNNNPVRYTDPTGHCIGPVLILCGAAAATAAKALFDAAVVTVGVVMVANSAQQIAQTMGDTGEQTADSATPSDSDSADDELPEVVIPKDKYPETAGHIEDAVRDGHPDELTIDRAGAKNRRKDSLKDKHRETGKDRDEYPPAMFREGGKGASVRNIKPSDNRGAGSCMGAQCRNLPDGTRVRVRVE
jgi:hypothetical protein